MEQEFHITEIKDIPEGDAARLDFRWVIKRGKITDFAINVSLLEGGRSTDVFRVDTKHEYLHEQRFWISPKPKALETDYNSAFVEKKKEVFENYERWIKLFKEARKRGDI
ncbi:MAG: hypothetical protein HYT70_04470 [Candidatus Aenigmarchaeota archaeon]|nr:hypothetical protein [Candidatus Aenigmarchaeota archaeon]